MIRVRNTFIHVEGASLVDDRVVQSMPHGMFSSCWLEEVGQALAESPGVACMAPATPAAANIILAAGSEIIVEGLMKYPAFNGVGGTVQSFDDEAGRYNVLLASHDGSAGQCAKIKGENLRLRVPARFESVAQRPEELKLVAMHAEDSECLASMPSTPEWQNQSTCQQLGVVIPSHVYNPNSYPHAFPVVRAAR